MAADLILPTAMWVEKEGAYGNAERRTHVWHQLVTAPGEARSDLWQLMEFSKRFKIEEVWPEDLLAKKPEYRGKTMFDVLYRNGQIDKFPVSDIEAGYLNDESKAFGFYVHKGLFEEYASFGREAFASEGTLAMVAERSWTSRRLPTATGRTLATRSLG